ncbi:MAG: ABC-2 transporter permease [Clostridia bacterium]|nr:ABC-2 transporter permease [Clostridia bacterium]
MKGLIIKDLYMTVKYCKVNILIALLWILLSLGEANSLLFAFYSVFLCDVIPSNILAYDEKSRWLQYSETMPYTRTQIVSGKYIVGLIFHAATLILIGSTRAATMISGGTFDFGSFGSYMMIISTMPLIASAIVLPFMFKSGTEKGRLIHLVMLIIIIMVGGVTSKVINNDVPEGVELLHTIPTGCIICIALFALSWFLSIVFYRKREL